MANSVEIQYVQFYTEGSAAKKIATPLPKKRVAEKPVAKRAKRKVIRIDPIAVLSLTVCLALAITLGLGIGKIQHCIGSGHCQRRSCQQSIDFCTVLQVKLRQLCRVQRKTCSVSLIDLDKFAKTEIFIDLAGKGFIRIIIFYRVIVAEKRFFRSF